MGLEVLIYDKKGGEPSIFEIDEDFHYWLFNKANLNDQEFIKILEIEDYYKTNALFSGKDLLDFILELEKIKSVTPYIKEIDSLLNKINQKDIEKIRITGD